MPYCTEADLIAEGLSAQDLTDLTDEEGTGSANDTRVAAAIESADELIDGYLRGRYNLPLGSVPKIVKQLSVSISIYNLYARTKRAAMPESIEKRYAADIKLLEGIQKGTITLGAAQAQQASSSGFFRTNKAEGDREFTKDVLDGY